MENSKPMNCPHVRLMDRVKELDWRDIVGPAAFGHGRVRRMGVVACAALEWRRRDVPIERGMAVARTEGFCPQQSMQGG